MDNVQFHHSKIVLDEMNNKRLIPLFTAPYSPDYNPIEMYFSWIKNHLRRNFNKSYKLIPNKELCQKWFRHSWNYSYIE